MKAGATLACALLAEQSVVDIIVKYRAGRGCSDCISQEVFERLEPCAVKVARTVLRRGSDGNATLLSDLCRPSSVSPNPYSVFLTPISHK